MKNYIFYLYPTPKKKTKVAAFIAGNDHSFDHLPDGKYYIESKVINTHVS